jgi:hypothetical protein
MAVQLCGYRATALLDRVVRPMVDRAGFVSSIGPLSGTLGAYEVSIIWAVD